MNKNWQFVVSILVLTAMIVSIVRPVFAGEDNSDCEKFGMLHGENGECVYDPEMKMGVVYPIPLGDLGYGIVPMNMAIEGLFPFVAGQVEFAFDAIDGAGSIMLRADKINQEVEIEGISEKFLYQMESTENGCRVLFEGKIAGAHFKFEEDSICEIANFVLSFIQQLVEFINDLPVGLRELAVKEAKIIGKAFHFLLWTSSGMAEQSLKSNFIAIATSVEKFVEVHLFFENIFPMFIQNFQIGQ